MQEARLGLKLLVSVAYMKEAIVYVHAIPIQYRLPTPRLYAEFNERIPPTVAAMCIRGSVLRDDLTYSFLTVTLILRGINSFASDDKGVFLKVSG